MVQERLQRRLGLTDAVVVGLGAMLGAGVFVAIAPAARAAGTGLLLGLAVAGAVAYCNAASSARLAARYPSSGGTYVYGRERLGAFWGHLAGWAFVVGKTASCAAIAVTFGAYAVPHHPQVAAVAVVLAATALNVAGVHKSARVTRIIVAVVLAVLAFVVTACLVAGHPSGARLRPFPGTDLHGVLAAAALIFFAFAGYARIATLGEEVHDPERTIGRAIPVALAITLVAYAAVFTSALLAVGPHVLAASGAPLRAAVASGDWEATAPAVQVGAAVAGAGSLLALLLGVSRTTLAMARDGYLPAPLARVHQSTPRAAELAVGAVVAVVAGLVDVRHAIGFSSFGVLTYYAIANASAWTLGRRLIPTLGAMGCAALAFALPVGDVAAGAGVLAVGMAAFAVVTTHRTRATPR